MQDFLRGRNLSSYALVVAVFCALCAACGPKETDATPLAKIGVLLPLGSDDGVLARRGAELAFKDLTERYGGSIHFQPEWEDSRGDPDNAGARAGDLARDPAVLGIVGPVNSAPARSAVGVANREGVVLVSPMASTPTLSSAGDFFFRTWPSDATEAAFVAQFTRAQLGVEKVFVMYIGNEYGIEIAKRFGSSFQEDGGSIVASVEYPEETEEFAALVARVLATSVEDLYFVGYPIEIAAFLKELRSRDSRLRVLSTAMMADPRVTSAAGENAEGVVFPFPDTYVSGSGIASMEHFQERFLSTFGEAPGFLAAQTYDAVTLLGEAIVAASVDGLPDRERVRQAIDNIHEFEGATGRFRLDVNGDALREFEMYVIRNGEMRSYRD